MSKSEKRPLVINGPILVQQEHGVWTTEPCPNAPERRPEHYCAPHVIGEYYVNQPGFWVARRELTFFGSCDETGKVIEHWPMSVLDQHAVETSLQPYGQPANPAEHQSVQPFRIIGSFHAVLREGELHQGWTWMPGTTARERMEAIQASGFPEAQLYRRKHLPILRLPDGLEDVAAEYWSALFTYNVRLWKYRKHMEPSFMAIEWATSGNGTWYACAFLSLMPERGHGGVHHEFSREPPTPIETLLAPPVEPAVDGLPREVIVGMIIAVLMGLCIFALIIWLA